MAKKILIVDDDDIARSTYAEVFRSDGFEVLEAVDGLEGLDKAIKEMPDVVFTGIIMPRMDGFALTQELAKNVATSKIPVFVNSHMGRVEDKEKAKELGAKDFFVQGMITPKQVVEKVSALFSVSSYKIKFNTEELDAFRLADDFHLGRGFICPECQEAKIIELEISDFTSHIFSAKFVCPKCGK